MPKNMQTGGVSQKPLKGSRGIKNTGSGVGSAPSSGKAKSHSEWPGKADSRPDPVNPKQSADK